VAKGVEGDFRLASLKAFRKQAGLSSDEVVIKFAGRSSIEFNVAGVNKALPFRYLDYHLNAVLDAMGYTSGSLIDAYKTHTLIAADGDGTVYAGPTLSEMPGLKTSPAREALIAYLDSGGVFMLISGNNLERSAMRLAEGLERSLLHRCLMVGNGAASMAVFDKNGRLKEIEDYRHNALQYRARANKPRHLDVIYIGDDGHKNGNDIDAFYEVGLTHSFLVAKETDALEQEFREIYVPGQLQGAKRILEAAHQRMERNQTGPVFTVAAIKDMLKDARV
jgi:hypothetical protein